METSTPTGDEPVGVDDVRRGVLRYLQFSKLAPNGHKIFGYTVDSEKRYVPDSEMAPIVTQIFIDYAHSVSMHKIYDRLNA